MRLDAAGGQIQGARSRQEDYWATEAVIGGQLVVVADGLGGHPAGNVASREAVTRMLKLLREDLDPYRASAEALLYSAVRIVHRQLQEMQLRDPELHGMATTLIAVFSADDRSAFVNVGDSLFWRLRNGELTQLNTRHTQDGGVTSCVGFRLAELEAEPLEIETGDRFLISSDGILSLKEDTIAELLGSAFDPLTAVDALLTAVEMVAHPHQDNCTVAVLFAPE